MTLTEHDKQTITLAILLSLEIYGDVRRWADCLSAAKVATRELQPEEGR